MAWNPFELFIYDENIESLLSEENQGEHSYYRVRKLFSNSSTARMADLDIDPQEQYYPGINSDEETE